MEVKYSPTKEIQVLGVDKRSADNLAWCAVASGINRLFWIGGYLICVEVYEKAFEYEMEKKVFPISQLCYAYSPEYRRIYEVRSGTQLPVVDMSDMKIYKKLLELIKEHEKGG